LPNVACNAGSRPAARRSGQFAKDIAGHKQYIDRFAEAVIGMRSTHAQVVGAVDPPKANRPGASQSVVQNSHMRCIKAHQTAGAMSEEGHRMKN